MTTQLEDALLQRSKLAVKIKIMTRLQQSPLAGRRHQSDTLPRLPRQQVHFPPQPPVSRDVLLKRFQWDAVLLKLATVTNTHAANLRPWQVGLHMRVLTHIFQTTTRQQTCAHACGSKLSGGIGCAWPHTAYGQLLCTNIDQTLMGNLELTLGCQQNNCQELVWSANSAAHEQTRYQAFHSTKPFFADIENTYSCVMVHGDITPIPPAFVFDLVNN